MSKELVLFIFTAISVIVVGVGLFLANKYLKTQKQKDILYIIVSFLTVIIHFSSILNSLLHGEPVEIIDTYYLPVYPCNVIMWENLVLALLMILNKRGKVFNVLGNATFFIGTICAFVGIEFNTNFLNNPSLLDYDILKGLLSHVTLLFCCVYTLVGKYIKITGIKNFFGVVAQAVIFGTCGIYTNAVKRYLGQPDVNSMFMEYPPFENLPFVNVYILVPIILAVFFIVFFIIEKRSKLKTSPNGTNKQGE